MIVAGRLRLPPDSLENIKRCPEAFSNKQTIVYYSELELMVSGPIARGLVRVGSEPGLQVQLNP